MEMSNAAGSRSSARLSASPMRIADPDVARTGRWRTIGKCSVMPHVDRWRLRVRCAAGFNREGYGLPAGHGDHVCHSRGPAARRAGPAVQPARSVGAGLCLPTFPPRPPSRRRGPGSATEQRCAISAPHRAAAAVQLHRGVLTARGFPAGTVFFREPDEAYADVSPGRCL